MKYLLVSALLLCSPIATSFSQTAAQDDVTTVVVLPFDARGSAQTYSLSLAIALARHLNTIDNVYVPPVGDVLLTLNRLQKENILSAREVLANYNADYVLSGRIELSNSDSLQARVQLGFAQQTDTLDNADLNVNLNEPKSVVDAVVLAALARLQLMPNSTDRTEIEAVMAQTPSLASLQVVSESASRVRVPNFNQLEAAANLDPLSSWVITERARAATLNSAFEDARRLAEEAVSLNIFDIEAWMVLAQVSLLQNDTARSQEAVERVLELNPNYAEAVLLHAELLQRDNQSEDARRAFQQALRINPRLVDGYLGLASLQTGAEASQTIRRGTLMVPESRNLQRAFVTQVILVGDNQGALEYVQERLRLSNDPVEYELLGLLEDNVSEAIDIAQHGQSVYPLAIEPLIAEANLQLRQGNIDITVDRLQQALSIQPNNALVRNQLALTYARQGNTDEAKRLLEQGANSSTSQYNLAQIYVETGEHQAAIAALEPFLSAYANDVDALTLYAVALNQVGREDQALNVLEQALRLEPNNINLQNIIARLKDPTSPTAAIGVQQVSLSAEQRAIFERGQAQLEANQAANALAEFSNARSYGDNGLLAFYEGLAAQSTGDVVRAIKAYEDALNMMEANDTLLNNLGYAHYQNGDSDKAINYLQQAIALDADNAQAQLNLGLASYSAGNIGLAAPALARALELEPTLGTTIVALTQDATAGGTTEELSLDSLNQRLRQQQAVQGQVDQPQTTDIQDLISEGARPHFNSGLAELEAGNPVEASRAFEQALVYGRSSIISFYAGFVQQRLGNYPEAIVRYEDALEEAPESALILNNIGFAYYLAGDEETALGYLARAVQADPNNIRAHINLGLVNYSLERYRSALNPLERAVSLNPAIEATEIAFADGTTSTLGALLTQTRQRLAQ